MMELLVLGVGYWLGPGVDVDTTEELVDCADDIDVGVGD